MDKNYLSALDKIIEDFHSMDINLCLAFATDPSNPDMGKSIKKLKELLESSMINLELLELQSDEYKLIAEEMRLKEIYCPNGKSILDEEFTSIDSLLVLICLHRSLVDFRGLLNASLEISQ